MFKLIVSGMLIGIANIIPGISGATLAVITNQYQRIVTNVSSLTSLHFNRVEWGYLISISMAAVGGIYIFSWPLDYGLIHFKSLTLMFITGLLMGSLGRVRLTDNIRSSKSRYANIWCVAGIALVIAIGWLPITGEVNGGRGIIHVLSGAIAMVAMLIPGVSGSMILVLLGTYTEVVQFIKNVDVIALLPFVLGALIGGGISIKGIQWMMRTHTNQFESFIIGAVLGSVVFILAQVNFASAHPLAVSLAFILGLVITWRLTHAR